MPVPEICATLEVLCYIWPAPQNSFRDPDIRVQGANMRPIWGRQDPGGPRVGPMNFAIWGGYVLVDGSSVLMDLQYDLFYKLGNGPASVMGTRHLMSTQIILHDKL